MNGQRDYIDYLRDILEHAEAAIEFVAVTPDVAALSRNGGLFGRSYARLR